MEIKIEAATLNQVHVSEAIIFLNVRFFFFSSQGQLEVFSSTETETRCCNYRQRILRRKLIEIRGKFLSGIVAQARKNLLHLRKFLAFSHEKNIWIYELSVWSILRFFYCPSFRNSKKKSFEALEIEFNKVYLAERRIVRSVEHQTLSMLTRIKGKPLEFD